MYKKLIKFIVFSLIVLFIFENINIFANSSKGMILKNFKKHEYRLLFESDKPILDKKARAIFDSSRKYELYKNIREKVQEKREFLENENIKITNKISNLSDSLKTIDKEIKNIKEETIKINNQIIYLTKTIKNKTKAINILKEKIAKNKDILYKYIVYLYKKGNFVFKDGEIDNLKAIFYSGEDIGNIINELNFEGIIQVTGKRLIDKHKGYINNLYIEQISLKKSELESKRLRKQLIIQQGLMKQKKEFKEKLLRISKGKQKIYQNFIAEKLEAEKKIKNKEFIARLAFIKNKRELLKREGCSFTDFGKIDSKKFRGSEKCRALNSMIYIESQLKGFQTDDAGNILEWPIKPSKGVSTFFHDSGYIALFGEDHEAIDIPASQGTDIKAPADGYVIYINKPIAKGYSFVALKHSNGIITVYGHLSKVLVKQMQIVKKGEVFAKSGGTPGTAGAGPMTSGAHLHFEVWKDKKLQDPLNFLNISYLKPENLPSIYFSKYKKDYKARTGKEFKGVLKSNRKNRTFKITGDTEIERQKNFLKKYATGQFKNWGLWVQEGIESKIDPTFLMCVGLAETGLGKNLKTPYNVGNVGNTDSGETKYFTSAADGIHAMAKTFNNKYLGKYNEIRLLSRYGNSDKPIYASSSDNWHNNIVSCMSFIKGRYISDNYNFRLK